MKTYKIGFLMLLLSSCQKELQLEPIPEQQSLIRHLSIISMCFDSNKYYVNYSIKGIRAGDSLFGGCDSSAEVNLQAKDGMGSFISYTDTCNVIIHLRVVKTDGKSKWLKKQGNCQNCK